MTHDIELLRNSMGAASDDRGRAVALIGHIKDKLDAAGTDPTALRELSTFLEVNMSELADRAVEPAVVAAVADGVGAGPVEPVEPVVPEEE